MPIRGKRHGQAGRVGRLSQGVVEETAAFLSTFIVLPEYADTVIAAWVLAAWMIKSWDRFPHLAISSPEKRCGKSTLLDLLALIVPKPLPASNPSPAVIYRVIEGTQPTLILDEAQSLSRKGSESGEVVRELLNAGIGKKSQVLRCGGGKQEFKVKKFSIYSPKIFAMIGDVDGVLADRSISISMRRMVKNQDHEVERFIYRKVEARAAEIKSKLEEFAKEFSEKAADLYSEMEPFNIDNARMADLLTPLQVVLTLDNPGNLDILLAYAQSLEEAEKRKESQTPKVKLLRACREIYTEEDVPFMETKILIDHLIARTEEPWVRWNKGAGMSPESLALLLRPFGISSGHNRARTKRGYYRQDFEEAWKSYLPPLKNLSNPSKPSRSK